MLLYDKNGDEFLKTLQILENRTHPHFFKTSKYIIYLMINQFYY